MGIFSANGILGQMDKDLTPALFEHVGRAFGLTIKRLIVAENHPPAILVAGDARLSTPLLKNALLKGLVAEHCKVYNLGSVPAPLLRFAVDQFSADAGLMVAASIQPAGYNGLKFFRKGRSFTRLELQLLQQELLEIEKAERASIHARRGRFVPDSIQPLREVPNLDFTRDYIASLTGKVCFNRGINVVVDGSNGCAGELLARILEELGCTVIRLHTDPDGRFLGHPPNPGDTRNLAHLIEKVRTSQADLGICLDSDGTSIGLVMEGGIPITAGFILFNAQDTPSPRASDGDDALLAAMRVIEAVANNLEGIHTLVAQLP